MTDRLRVLKWVGVALGALLLTLIGTVAFLGHSDALRGPITQLVAKHLRRPVHADGMSEVSLFSLRPHAVFTGVTIGNPPWASRKDFVTIGRIFVQIDLAPLLHGSVVLPRIDAHETEIYLVRDANNRANWRIGSIDGSPTPHDSSRLALVLSLDVKRAHVELSDAMRGLTLVGIASADEQTAGRHSWTRLDGKGIANGKPYSIAANGQPLTGVRAHQPYVLTADVHQGTTEVSGRVSLDEPFDPAKLQADLKGSGESLVELSHLTKLRLPPTAPYSLQTRLLRDGRKVRLTQLRGTVGSSDVNGEIDVDTSKPRTFITADIRSQDMNFKDLGPGARSGVAQTAADGKPTAGSRPAPAPPTDRLIPDLKLDPVRLRRLDAAVQFHADRVETRKTPLRDMTFQLRLDHGALAIEPVSFKYLQGRVSGNVKVDAGGDDPKLSLDARIADMQLSQWHTKSGGSPVQGVMSGRAVLQGRGRSVREALSTADGTVTAVVPHGEVDAAFAELAGMDVANRLGLMLTHSRTQEDVRCAVAQFRAQKGTLHAENLVFDTEDVLITGKGEVNLGTEQWHLSLQGQPKKPRLRLRSPVTVGGTLLNPTFGINSGSAVGQGSVAIGLAALLTPIAAVLAFVDPGLGKNADCAALLQTARTDSPATGTARAAGGHTPAQH